MESIVKYPGTSYLDPYYNWFCITPGLYRLQVPRYASISAERKIPYLLKYADADGHAQVESVLLVF